MIQSLCFLFYSAPIEKYHLTSLQTKAEGRGISMSEIIIECMRRLDQSLGYVEQIFDQRRLFITGIIAVYAEGQGRKPCGGGQFDEG